MRTCVVDFGADVDTPSSGLVRMFLHLLPGHHVVRFRENIEPRRCSIDPRQKAGLEQGRLDVGQPGSGAKEPVDEAVVEKHGDDEDDECGAEDGVADAGGEGAEGEGELGTAWAGVEDDGRRETRPGDLSSGEHFAECDELVGAAWLLLSLHNNT